MKPLTEKIITIQTRRGAYTVTAYGRDGLYINRHVGWRITHEKSGFALGKYKDRESAERALRILLSTDIDWRREAVELYMFEDELQDALRPHLDEIKPLTYGPPYAAAWERWLSPKGGAV